MHVLLCIFADIFRLKFFITWIETLLHNGNVHCAGKTIVASVGWDSLYQSLH